MLICTSGPASAAALRFFDRMIGQGALTGRIFYSGDFDIRGLEMGNVLASRYPEFYTAWHFRVDAYVREVNGIGTLSFTEDERDRLSKMKVLWDSRLTEEMVRYGHKRFQEQIVSMLAADWLAAVYD
jgi:hypothetical protein